MRAVSQFLSRDTTEAEEMFSWLECLSRHTNQVETPGYLPTRRAGGPGETSQVGRPDARQFPSSAMHIAAIRSPWKALFCRAESDYLNS